MIWFGVGIGQKYTKEQHTTEKFGEIETFFTCNFLPRGLELVGPGVVPVDVNGTEEELLVKACAQSWLTWSEM